MNALRIIILVILATIISSCSSYKHNTALSVAKNWEVVYLDSKKDLPKRFQLLHEHGFKTKNELKPNTMEKYVYDRTILYTEPSEMLMVAVHGDKYIALAAGVYYFNNDESKTINEEREEDDFDEEDTLEPVPEIFFGGLFFKYGSIKDLKSITSGLSQ